jgi:TonB family protein
MVASLRRIVAASFLCAVLWGADEIRVQRLVAMPQYPLLAASARIQGEVRLKCTIGGDGSVQKTEALSGHRILAEAARENAFQWGFAVPTSREGVDRMFTLVYRFRLGETCSSPNCKTRFIFDYPNLVTVEGEAPRWTP